MTFHKKKPELVKLPTEELHKLASPPVSGESETPTTASSVVRVVDFDLQYSGYSGILYTEIMISIFFCVSSIAPQFWRRRRAAIISGSDGPPAAFSRSAKSMTLTEVTVKSH